MKNSKQITHDATGKNTASRISQALFWIARR